MIYELEINKGLFKDNKMKFKNNLDLAVTVKIKKGEHDNSIDQKCTANFNKHNYQALENGAAKQWVHNYTDYKKMVI